MAENLTELLTSDSFRLLRLLENLQTETLDGPRIRENQDEIAELMHISKGKLNPLMQALVSSGCIAKYRARSGYVMTPMGEKVVEHIEEIDRFARIDGKKRQDGRRKR